MDSFIARNTPYLVQFLYYGTVFGTATEISLSANATVYIQGKTGNGRIVHFLSREMVHDGTDILIELLESPTFTADGTATITAYNNNRLSAKTAGFTIYSNPPDATNDGTCIGYNRIFGSAAGVGQATTAAGLTVSGLERMMKKNTDYALKITNASAATTLVLNWQWYESGN